MGQSEGRTGQSKVADLKVYSFRATTRVRQARMRTIGRRYRVCRDVQGKPIVTVPSTVPEQSVWLNSELEQVPSVVEPIYERVRINGSLEPSLHLRFSQSRETLERYTNRLVIQADEGRHVFAVSREDEVARDVSLCKGRPVRRLDLSEIYTYLLELFSQKKPSILPDPEEGIFNWRGRGDEDQV